MLLVLLLVICNVQGEDTILLSRPRTPTWAKYYPPLDLLNCEGTNFSSTWRDFRYLVEENAAQGFPKDKRTLAVASQIYRDWGPESTRGSMKQVEVLLKRADVTDLRNFCLFGFAAALFVLYRHDLNVDHLLSIQALLGWEEWPVDFSESSGWPTFWRIVPLHLEHAARRGDTTWSGELQGWGQEERFLPRPTVANVDAALTTWLLAAGAEDHRLPASGSEATGELRASLRSLHGRPLRILVAGHHMGSSMEPFSMLREALRVGVRVEIEAQFHGQRHPAPNIVCLEFGYCNDYKALEDWFRRYESRFVGEYDWMAERWPIALSELADVIRGDAFMVQADFVICGGPAWFCAMLRGVRPGPMLLYFAWPAVPMVPDKLKPQVLWQMQALAQTVSPSTVFVAANWILAAQFALQFRIFVPVQRPHGLYVNQTYSPVAAPNGSPRILVSRLGQWTRQGGVALVEMMWALIREEQTQDKVAGFPFELVFLSIRFRGVEPIYHVSYEGLSQFHACIFWPWDVMMLLFDELYTMGMPLLVPERQWMHNIMMHTLQHTDMNWWHIRAATVSGVLPSAVASEFPLPHDPWIGKFGSVAEASYWYELTDFVQFPHVTYFSSLPDMLQKVKTLDVPAVTAGMRQFNQRTLRESMSFYRSAAAQLVR